MATLRDSLIDNHQPNESILAYGIGDNGGYTMVGFHQLGRTREEIVAKYAPELSLWLCNYLLPPSQPGDDLTDAELVARDRRLSVRALTNNLLQTVRSYGTSQCGQYRYEFTYELTRITKVSTQWYIGINILATSVL